jgi:hypothetical protein
MGFSFGGLKSIAINAISNTLTVAGNILPDADATRSLGTTGLRWLGYFSQILDGANVQRMATSSTTSTVYQGTPAASGTAHVFKSLTTLTGVGQIAAFHNDTTAAAAESYIHNAGDFVVASSLGTAPSATGVTVDMAGAATRTFVHKVTVSETALTAAATTEDITLWTVPAKTKIKRVIADCTTGFTGGGLTNMTVMVGPAAGSNAYLLAGSIFAAATLGDVVAEMGAGLVSATLADIPSFSGTTVISARFTSTTANVVAATAGSVTFYIEGTVYV